MGIFILFFFVSQICFTASVALKDGLQPPVQSAGGTSIQLDVALAFSPFISLPLPFWCLKYS
jgi:hypothetical protein